MLCVFVFLPVYTTHKYQTKITYMYYIHADTGEFYVCGLLSSAAFTSPIVDSEESAEGHVTGQHTAFCVSVSTPRK